MDGASGDGVAVGDGAAVGTGAVAEVSTPLPVGGVAPTSVLEAAAVGVPVSAAPQPVTTAAVQRARTAETAVKVDRRVRPGMTAPVE
ncbi:hypothetical protein ACGF12_31655 [Kitasatospora sp. NPDC048296]|uniref:hypothetical protein n=1 Tax=Kitasatospora sp. NPDC048296 TaxID=3364048 RepID=UPI00371D1205